MLRERVGGDFIQHPKPHPILLITSSELNVQDLPDIQSYVSHNVEKHGKARERGYRAQYAESGDATHGNETFSVFLFFSDMVS